MAFHGETPDHHSKDLRITRQAFPHVLHQLGFPHDHQSVSDIWNEIKSQEELNLTEFQRWIHESKTGLQQTLAFRLKKSQVQTSIKIKPPSLAYATLLVKWSRAYQETQAQAALVTPASVREAMEEDDTQVRSVVVYSMTGIFE